MKFWLGVILVSTCAIITGAVYRFVPVHYWQEVGVILLEVKRVAVLLLVTDLECFSILFLTIIVMVMGYADLETLKTFSLIISFYTFQVVMIYFSTLAARKIFRLILPKRSKKQKDVFVDKKNSALLQKEDHDPIVT